MTIIVAAMQKSNQFFFFRCLRSIILMKIFSLIERIFPYAKAGKKGLTSIRISGSKFQS